MRGSRCTKTNWKNACSLFERCPHLWIRSLPSSWNIHHVRSVRLTFPHSSPTNAPYSERVIVQSIQKQQSIIPAPQKRHTPKPGGRKMSRRKIMIGLGLIGVATAGAGIFSYEASANLWFVSIGMVLYTYRGHSDAVNAVMWSPDGKRIASGGYDRTVQIWKAE
jgi:hypothetical protein